MTDPLDYISTYALKPRYDGFLIAGGVLLILGGAFAGCVGLATPLALMASFNARVAMSPSVLLFLMFTYLLISTALVWTGIASIRHRRWVRPVVMIAGLVGAYFGAVTLCAMVYGMFMFTGGTSARGLRYSPPAPAYLVGISVALLFYIAVPLAFFFTYRANRIRERLDAFDPGPGWTDGISMPTLGMCLIAVALSLFGWGALALPEVPMFGLIWSRALAALLLAIIAISFLIGARSLYRLQLSGWWMIVGTYLAVQLSGLLNILVFGGRLFTMLSPHATRTNLQISMAQGHALLPINLTGLLPLLAVWWCRPKAIETARLADDEPMQALAPRSGEAMRVE